MPISNFYRAAPIHRLLGGDFFDEVEPAQFPAHLLRWRNQVWAERVGLGELTEAEWLDAFGKFTPLPGNFGKPLALRYHGHQFQSYNPNLGDGRGFLFAQVVDHDGGRVLDLATKGSGLTPYSRSGDGRLTLKGGVREVLAAQMLEALGVDSSKAFSVVETGEQLVRNDEPSPTRSCVLVRLSHSHIRIGTFERFAALGDTANIERLLEHCLAHYGFDAVSGAIDAKAEVFLAGVCRRVAETCAGWLAAGFVHGVLNSDNVNITGESFDYGPWRFVPHFDPLFTAAYFDHNGLYAFARQPVALAWNLARLAECLSPFADGAALKRAQDTFTPSLQAGFRRAMLRRLGLKSRGDGADGKLVEALLNALIASKAPFEQAIFDFYCGPAGQDRRERSPVAEVYRGMAFAPVVGLLADYEPSDATRLQLPYFMRSRPCTLLIEDVEALWAPIAERDDWGPFQNKLTAIDEVRQAYGF